MSIERPAECCHQDCLCTCHIRSMEVPHTLHPGDNASLSLQALLSTSVINQREKRRLQVIISTHRT
uniref:Major sperm protein n=1 Tax=Parascaris univalens TaxID=6257 RepID=A0A915AMA3_PARUN